MKKREAAVITAYTGIFMGAGKEFHQYAEKLMGHSIFTHELASKKLWKELKKKSEKDFMELCNNLED